MLLMVDNMTTENEEVSNPTAPQETVAHMDQSNTEAKDYTFVSHKARIACYDDPLSEPRIVEVAPAPTREFLTNLAQAIWQQVRVWDSPIPYTVIADVSENFIHAQFTEMVVSIFDQGKTIRFSDQGPGIPHKEMAQEWGFSTATEPMKDYIHGVGSGLPRVKEFLACKNGTISIEDNLGSGAVVTISFNKQTNFNTDDEVFDGEDFTDDEFDNETDYYLPHAAAYPNTHTNVTQPYYQPQSGYPYGAPQQGVPYTQPGIPYPQPVSYGTQQPISMGYPQPAQPQVQQPYYNQNQPIQPTQGYYPVQSIQTPQAQIGAYQNPGVDIGGIVSNLSKKERQVFSCFTPGAYLRNKEIGELCNISESTVNNALQKMEMQGLLKKMANKSRTLTELGVAVVTYLSQINPNLR